MKLFEKAKAVYESSSRTDLQLLGGLYNNMALVCVSLKRFAQAAELAANNMDETIKYESSLRDRLIKRVTEEIPYSIVNGDLEKRLSNNANFCFRFIEGESLLILLDQNGICASSGSACTSGSLDPSHVLLAIGLPHEIAHGSVRLTISNETTIEDIDYTVDTLKRIIDRLRSMSPLFEDFVKKNREASK